MASIYTKQGDDGHTIGCGGRRVAKNDAHCQALGALDELSSHVGLCLQAAAGREQESVRKALLGVQPELLTLGAMLFACGDSAAEAGAPTIGPGTISRMESLIDASQASLGELTHFVLLGGCELACRLHVARAVCRRAERDVVALASAGPNVPPIALAYLNRLSDLLFALARRANADAGIRENTWRG